MLAGAVVVTETMAVAVAAAPVLAEGAAAPGVWPGERNVVPVPVPALVEPVAAEEEPDAVLEPLALPLADVWADVPVALALAEVPVRALVAWQLLRVGGTVSKGGWVQRLETPREWTYGSMAVLQAGIWVVETDDWARATEAKPKTARI